MQAHHSDKQGPLSDCQALPQALQADAVPQRAALLSSSGKLRWLLDDWEWDMGNRRMQIELQMAAVRTRRTWCNEYKDCRLRKLFAGAASCFTLLVHGGPNKQL
jgi:hypothetical protein